MADYLLAISISRETMAESLLTIWKTRKAISVSRKAMADYLLTVLRTFFALSVSCAAIADYFLGRLPYRDGPLTASAG